MPAADPTRPTNPLEQMAGYYAVQLGRVQNGRADQVHGSTRTALEKQGLIERVPANVTAMDGTTLPLYEWRLTTEGERLHRQAYGFLMEWLKTDLDGTV